MSQVTCTGCWSRYPAGSTVCKQCKVPLEAPILVAGQQPAGSYRVPRQPIVSLVRKVLALYAICWAGPLVAAISDRDRAASLFGQVTAGRLATLTVSQQQVTTAVIGAAIGTLLSWCLLAFIARWYVGRMILFVWLGMSTLLTYIVAKPDLAFPGVQIQTFGSLVIVGVLGYAVVRGR